MSEQKTGFGDVLALILIVIVVGALFSLVLPDGLGALGIMLMIIFIGWGISQM